MAKQILDIEHNFGAIIKKVVPEFEKVQPSLISILKAYSETNLSNLLGYLFKGEDHQLLQKIFLQTLIDLFNQDFPDEDEVDKYLPEIKVDLEYATKFGRIDILIRRENKSLSKNWAIIIENKLYHHLNNDLDDYYFSVCDNFAVQPKNVLVVILALREASAGIHTNMRHEVIYHSILKENVVSVYAEHNSQVNDRSISLIMNEYFRHIDDLYQKSTSSSNQNCLQVFFENLQSII